MESIEEKKRWERRMKLMIAGVVILGLIILAELFWLTGLNCEHTALLLQMRVVSCRLPAASRWPLKQE